MTTYILLRKNKESGPFSLSELKGTELFPNDLIWVEGQSACWLNPGEIKELKDLVGQKPSSATDHFSAYLPPEKKEDLPDPVITSDQIPAAVQPLPAVIGKPDPVSPDPVKDPAEPETRYAKPLDEIKALYLRNLERNQQRKGLNLVIPPVVKKMAPYAAVLVVGLLTGILINKKKGARSLPPAVIAEQPVSAPIQRPAADPVETDAALVVSNTSNGPIPAETIPVESRLENDLPEAPVTKKGKSLNPPEKRPAERPVLPAQEERTNRQQEPAPVPKENTKEDLTPFVSVSANDYQVGSFGGIRNLQLTLKNDSRFLLEQVTVELRYYKPGDEILKTERVLFYAVPARGMQVLAIPKTNRGVKVSCQVQRIESRQQD